MTAGGGPWREWAVEHQSGSAGALHSRELPDPVRRSVWWFTVERSALVLGSTQSDAVVDAQALAEADIDLVRRHSGGGAVLVVPGDVSWVDVILPAADPLWDDDVGRAFDWLGAAWAATLTSLGIASVEAHSGPIVRTPWSDLVCFAGLGRGEVTVDGRKVLGISQRRNRSAARFQCALLHLWEPKALLGVLALGRRERGLAEHALADVATGLAVPDPVGIGESDLVDTLLAHLPL